MRFFQDSDAETEVQWYFVPEGTPYLGLPTLFYSRIWDRKTEPQEHLGEVYDPHPYSKGRPPYPIAIGGLCGTPEQWLSGGLSTDPVPPLQPGTDWPVCCAPVPAVNRGGFAIGGQGTVLEVPPTIPDCSILNPAAYQYTFTLSGITNGTCGDCAAAFNGTFIVTWFFACVWEYTIPGTTCGVPSATIALVGNTPTDFSLGFPITMLDVSYTCTDFTLYGGTFTLATTPGGLCNGWPATIVVTPVY
jgi:hypothetical protein